MWMFTCVLAAAVLVLPVMASAASPFPGYDVQPFATWPPLPVQPPKWTSGGRLTLDGAEGADEMLIAANSFGQQISECVHDAEGEDS